MCVAVVAGEPSGDILGGALLRALREIHPDLVAVGMAGPAMLAAGCEPYAHIDDLSIMGLTEVLRSYPRLLRLRAKLVTRFAAAAPDVFVGIDVPDFNLGLACRLKARGIPTVQYVCPQVWAWRPGRAAHLHRAVDRLLALLPFEPAFFADYGVEARFVGHPLADQLPLDPDRQAARRALGIDPGATLVTLLPGSRRQELVRLLAPFVASAQLLYRQRPQARFVLCLAHPAQVAEVTRQLTLQAPELPCTVVPGLARQVLTAADVALVASGTATLEALLCETPMVVGYRLSALSYPIIRAMMKIPRVALPNILAGHALVPELLQDELTAPAACAALLHWLDNSAAREGYVRESRRLHHALRGDAANTAAAAVLELVPR